MMAHWLRTLLLAVIFTAALVTLTNIFFFERTKAILEDEDYAKDAFGSAQPLASSGKLFTGEILRRFPNHLRKTVTRRKAKVALNSTWCAANGSGKWAVLTTVFKLSEAVRRFLYRSDWCVVVAGDERTPPYGLVSSFPSNVIFLSADDQRAIGAEFVDGLPWNSFGRKNVGYLYAVAHGAKVIWDFDDDNMLTFWMQGAATDRNQEIDHFIDTAGENKALSFTSKWRADKFYCGLWCIHAKCYLTERGSVIK
jgi:hypothetical protein